MSVGSELAAELQAAAAELEHAEQAALAARERRDELIRRASAEGVGDTAIGRLVGLERMRVWSIRTTDSRPSSNLPIPEG